MKKVKAFTLYELLIGMLITSIAIATIYVVILFIHKNFSNYKNFNRNINDYVFHHQQLKSLFENSDLIILAEDSICKFYHTAKFSDTLQNIGTIYFNKNKLHISNEYKKQNDSINYDYLKWETIEIKRKILIKEIFIVLNTKELKQTLYFYFNKNYDKFAFSKIK